MFQTATVSDASEPRNMGGWGFWLTSAVLTPIAASLTLWFLTAQGQDDWIVAAAGTAVLAGVIYAVVGRLKDMELAALVGGYLLAAVLTVPWGYALLISAIILACRGSEQCLS